MRAHTRTPAAEILSPLDEAINVLLVEVRLFMCVCVCVLCVKQCARVRGLSPELQ